MRLVSIVLALAFFATPGDQPVWSGEAFAAADCEVMDIGKIGGDDSQEAQDQEKKEKKKKKNKKKKKDE
jgi:hypothetical protein